MGEKDITEKILEEYLNKELDEVVIIYTKMLNGVQTETETRHLLPLEKEHFNKNVPVGVQMEQLAMVPSAEALMENIIPIYIQGFVYGALVESYASEHNLRMLAMQSATDSASAMLNDLSIQYNRVRQAAITQEITGVSSIGISIIGFSINGRPNTIGSYMLKIPGMKATSPKLFHAFFFLKNRKIQISTG